MDRTLLNHLGERMGVSGLEATRLSGGDIHDAYLLQNLDSQYFLKYNDSLSAAQMMDAEVVGLREILASNHIAIPQIYDHGRFEKFSFILMQYIEPGIRSAGFWTKFGHHLALLHGRSRREFGYETDNFIGWLSQSNQAHESWSDFYAHERILPQVRMAILKKHLDNDQLRSAERMCSRLDQLCPREAPSLIHGDLWSGNFLCNQDGLPVLIDPAVCYAHREMDLSLSMLFGGFSRLFYESYHETFPLQSGFEGRVGIYQLYYLLVHLNLFGPSYRPKVCQILAKYGN